MPPNAGMLKTDQQYYVCINPTKTQLYLCTYPRRAVYHYRYLQSYRHRGNRLFGWMKGDGLNLSFAEFTLSEQIRNFQTGYTGTDLNRYELVGITERLREFTVRAGIANKESETPLYNKTLGAQLTLGIVNDPAFIRDFKQFHAADYSMYEQAAAQYEARLGSFA
jgi:hypothetical protein